MPKPNISGVEGVFLEKTTTTVRSAKGKVYRYPRLNWVAAWMVRHKLKRKRFAVNKYGNEKAKALATEARNKALKQKGKRDERRGKA